MGLTDWQHALGRGELLILLAWAAIAIVVDALFLLWGASVAKVHKRSLGRALAASVLSVGAMLIVVFQAGGHNASPLLAYVAGFVFETLLVMPIFATSLRRAAAAVAVSRASLMVALVTWWIIATLLNGNSAVAGAHIV